MTWHHVGDPGENKHRIEVGGRPLLGCFAVDPEAGEVKVDVHDMVEGAIRLARGEDFETRSEVIRAPVMRRRMPDGERHDLSGGIAWSVHGGWIDRAGNPVDLPGEVVR